MRHSRLYMALLCWILFTTIHAQLSDPREKLSISATIDGATNTDYYWNSNNERHIENGRLKHGINAKVRANLKLLGYQKFSLSISPFYNFSNRELCPDTPTPLFNVPTKHHHYGGSLTGNYNTMCFGKPLSFMAIASGNFSQYGFEDASAMLGGFFSITRNQKTFFALGAICLFGTSVSWPLYPLIIYTHKFDERWSINCFETNNYLYYQASPILKYALGMEIESDKIYLRPKILNLPEKAEISQVSERFGFFTDIQATKEVTLNLGIGATIPFYGRLRESGHNHTYMTMHDHVKPFVKMKVKYSLYKQ